MQSSRPRKKVAGSLGENKLLMKKEIEELEDIPIPTTLQCILRSNVRNLVSNEKRQQSWKLGTPYIDLGQTKRKQAKAYNLMTGIPFLFKQQMQE